MTKSPFGQQLRSTLVSLLAGITAANAFSLGNAYVQAQNHGTLETLTVLALGIYAILAAISHTILASFEDMPTASIPRTLTLDVLGQACVNVSLILAQGWVVAPDDRRWLGLGTWTFAALQIVVARKAAPLINTTYPWRSRFLATIRIVALFDYFFLAGFAFLYNKRALEVGSAIAIACAAFFLFDLIRRTGKA